MAKRGIVVPDFEEVIASPPEEITEAPIVVTNETEKLQSPKETPVSDQQDPK